MVTDAVRVLVVDDCQDNADTVAALLDLFGFEARVAYDASAAFTAAAQWQPQVAIIDLAMPRVSGTWIARELRRPPAVHRIFLIAMSGYADRTHKCLAEQAGFEAFLVKPFAASELQEAIKLGGAIRRMAG